MRTGGRWTVFAVIVAFSAGYGLAAVSGRGAEVLRAAANTLGRWADHLSAVPADPAAAPAGAAEPWPGRPAAVTPPAGRPPTPAQRTHVVSPAAATGWQPPPPPEASVGSPWPLPVPRAYPQAGAAPWGWAGEGEVERDWWVPGRDDGPPPPADEAALLDGAWRRPAGGPPSPAEAHLDQPGVRHSPWAPDPGSQLPARGALGAPEADVGVGPTDHPGAGPQRPPGAAGAGAGRGLADVPMVSEGAGPSGAGAAIAAKGEGDPSGLTPYGSEGLAPTASR